VIRNVKSGTMYPASSNAKLVDFYFDGQKISSKAGTKGGTASATGFIDILNYKMNLGIIKLDGDKLDFYNNVLASIDKNSTLDFYVDMLNKFFYTKGTAWYYLLNQSKIAQNNVNKDSVVAWLTELHNDKNKFIEFLDTFWELTGSTSTKRTSESIYNEFSSTKDLILFSSIMYPLSSMVSKYLNDNYGEILTEIMQQSQDTIQAYLIMEIKDTEMTFVSKGLGSAHYAFEPKGSGSNAFSSTIGITTGSVSRR